MKEKIIYFILISGILVLLVIAGIMTNTLFSLSVPDIPSGRYKKKPVSLQKQEKPPIIAETFINVGSHSWKQVFKKKSSAGKLKTAVKQVVKQTKKNKSVFQGYTNQGDEKGEIFSPARYSLLMKRDGAIFVLYPTAKISQMPLKTRNNLNNQETNNDQ